MVNHLKSCLQRRNIIVIGRSQLCASLDKSFGASGLLVACETADLPTFLQHAASDTATEPTGSTANDNEFGHDHWYSDV